MKIYTVTYWGGNYGSCLQAYALQACLKGYGCNAYVLTERKKKGKYSKLHSLWKSIKPEKHYSIIQKLKRKIQTKRFKVKRDKLKQFSNQYISVKTITDRRHFIENIAEDDVFIAGSDQIWNPLITGGVDKAYFLDFTNDKTKKISYAPSMGTGRIFGFHLKKMFRMIKEKKD